MMDFHVVQIGKRFHVVMGVDGYRRRLTKRGYMTKERAQIRANDEAYAFNRRTERVDAELARIERLIREQR